MVVPFGGLFALHGRKKTRADFSERVVLKPLRAQKNRPKAVWLLLFLLG
jgi:hypothetical protein